MTFVWHSVSPTGLHIYIKVLCQIDPETRLILMTLGHTPFIEIIRFFCWLHGCLIRLLIPMSYHTRAYPLHWYCQIFVDLATHSICWSLWVIILGMHPFSLSSLSQSFFHSESILVVLATYHILTFVSSVLGCRPHVSSSFSLLDYHFSLNIIWGIPPSLSHFDPPC